MRHLLVSISLIPQFKKDNDLQKVHCFVLTDGEAGGLHVARENTLGGRGSMGCGGGHGYLRNRRSGHVYQIGYNYSDFTYVMLRDLRDCIEGCKLHWYSSLWS